MKVKKKCLTDRMTVVLELEMEESSFLPEEAELRLQWLMERGVEVLFKFATFLMKETRSARYKVNKVEVRRVDNSAD